MKRITIPNDFMVYYELEQSDIPDIIECIKEEIAINEDLSYTDNFKFTLSCDNDRAEFNECIAEWIDEATFNDFKKLQN